MFFGAAERILQEISEVKDIQVAIISLSQVRMLDATGAHALVEVISALELRGITVLVKGVQPEHLALVTNVGVIRSLRHHKHLFTELPSAVEHDGATSGETQLLAFEVLATAAAHNDPHNVQDQARPITAREATASPGCRGVAHQFRPMPTAIRPMALKTSTL